MQQGAGAEAGGSMQAAGSCVRAARVDGASPRVPPAGIEHAALLLLAFDAQ